MADSQTLPPTPITHGKCAVSLGYPLAQPHRDGSSYSSSHPLHVGDSWVQARRVSK